MPSQSSTPPESTDGGPPDDVSDLVWCQRTLRIIVESEGGRPTAIVMTRDRAESLCRRIAGIENMQERIAQAMKEEFAFLPLAGGVTLQAEHESWMKAAGGVIEKSGLGELLSNQDSA